MKFKFFYVKHKITGEFVHVQYSEIDDATSFISLGLSKYESDQPYLTDKLQQERLLNGDLNNSWEVLIYDDLEKAIEENNLEIIEIEL